ncbi:hypothetical protein PG994_008729 [Apiospora phragmitis]|uniref:Uncharacterized protein n=1 Tax=Apiospora phragmitis TaxID=2905665 RepID=A0ABR1UJM8_9PEZI
MLGKSHHHLDENQMEALLQEANSTISGNIAVSQAIDFFERPLSPESTASTLPSPPTSPRSSRQSRQFLTSLSPRNRRSSAEDRATASLRRRNRGPAPSPWNRQLRPPNSSKKMNRGYKRISRPWGLPSPTASPDLRDLLVAYLSGLSMPPSSNTTATSSPATSQPSFSPASSIFETMESESPGLDLLEPSPLRNKRSVAAFGRPIEEPVHNIGDIFEVLGPSN